MKMFVGIIMLILSFTVNARQDYNEIRSQCASIESPTEMDLHLCKRMLVIEEERNQCSDSALDCDEQELGHLLALYWATQMIR